MYLPWQLAPTAPATINLIMNQCTPGTQMAQSSMGLRSLPETSTHDQQWESLISSPTPYPLSHILHTDKSFEPFLPWIHIATAMDLLTFPMQITWWKWGKEQPRRNSITRETKAQYRKANSHKTIFLHEDTTITELLSQSRKANITMLRVHTINCCKT